MSDAFWDENAYAPDEPDRVILCVDLSVENNSIPVWHKTYVMDAWGNARGTAMARLVSVPLSMAVESVLNREIPAGVTPAPHDPKLIARYMDKVNTLAQHLQIVGHLA